MKRSIKDILFLILTIIGILICLIAVFANILSRHDILAVDFSIALKPPCLEYPFGTDNLGRCVYSRVIFGIQSSLGMSFLLVAVLFFIGTGMGMTAGYWGGILDSLIMRITDMMLAFPGLVISIAIVGILGPGWLNTLIALMVPGWIDFARVSRSLTIAEREKDYIKSAHLSGAKIWQIFLYYIIPNIMPQMLILAVSNIGIKIIGFSGLAYLGLGVQPPYPELGVMLSEAREYMQTAPWLMVYPGAALFFIVMIFNLISDGLRDKLDPKNQKTIYSKKKGFFGRIYEKFKDIRPFCELWRKQEHT